MTRSAWLAALAVATLSRPCPAQFGGHPQPPQEPWTVKAEIGEGRSVTGTLRLAAVLIDCDLGFYELNPARIKVVRFSGRADSAPNNRPFPIPFGAGFPMGMFVNLRGTVVTSSGEEIRGSVAVPAWKIETELGALTLNPETLKSITFIERVRTKDGRTEGAQQPQATRPPRAATGAADGRAWEYKRTYNLSGDEDFNRLGTEGWDLVVVVQEKHDNTAYIFKRPKR